MKTELNLTLTKPSDMSVEDWVTLNLRALDIAAQDDPATASADAFSSIDHTSYVINETIAPATITLQELARAVATLIQYIQNRGPRKA